MPRRIAVVLTTRGNYAKMKSTMRAIAQNSDLDLVTIVGGGIVQERFGDFRSMIQRDGFAVDAVIDFLVGDGATLADQTVSAGHAVTMVGEVLGRLRPDILLVIADRWESLAFALASTTMCIPIAHLEGGEVSGSIDERIRHAITKLAHFHFPANGPAAARIIRMGEDPARVTVVGTPSLDMISDIDLDDVSSLGQAAGGEGNAIDFSKDYLVVSQHPVVTEAMNAEQQIVETANAVASLKLPVVWMLPNMDAGSGGVMQAVDRLRKGGLGVPLRTYPSMGFEHYAILLAHTRCLVGNSSSGIREGAFLGTPVVNIGTRQTGRERSHNVIDVGYDRREIAAAIVQQIANGRYSSDPIYGDGRSGAKIAEALISMPLDLEKTITY